MPSRGGDFHPFCLLLDFLHDLSRCKPLAFAEESDQFPVHQKRIAVGIDDEAGRGGAVLEDETGQIVKPHDERPGRSVRRMFPPDFLPVGERLEIPFAVVRAPHVERDRRAGRNERLSVLVRLGRFGPLGDDEEPGVFRDLLKKLSLEFPLFFFVRSGFQPGPKLF